MMATGILPVLHKALRDSRRGTLWLSIGLALYAIMIMAFYPVVQEQDEELTDLIDSMPRQMISLFYSGDTDNLSLSDPGNYIHTQYLLWLVLLLGAVVIGQAFNAITNAERDGSLDMLLSLPVSRRAMLLGRMANTLIGVFVVLAISYAVFFAFSLFMPEFEIGAGELALATFGAMLPLLLVTCFAYMLAALVPARRRFAGAVAYFMLIGSYAVYGYTAVVPDLEWIAPLMFFHYYNAADLVHEGIAVGDWAVLLGMSALYFGLAWWAIERREFNG